MITYSKISRAREYLESLRTFNNIHIPNSIPKTMSPPENIIRICVIDTGLNMSDGIIKGKKNRVLARKSWVGEDTHDNCGHGTHISRLFLGNTNSTVLLIAKVTNNKEFHESSIANIVEVCVKQSNCSRSYIDRQSSGLSTPTKVLTSYRYRWDSMRISPRFRKQSGQRSIRQH